MKAKTPFLRLVDVQEPMDDTLRRKLQAVADNPRERVRGLLLVWDWRDVAVRHLRRRFPQFWIYRGGRHIAIHASPPPEPYWTERGGRVERAEAGACLARIIEDRSTNSKSQTPNSNE